MYTLHQLSPAKPTNRASRSCRCTSVRVLGFAASQATYWLIPGAHQRTDALGVLVVRQLTQCGAWSAKAPSHRKLSTLMFATSAAPQHCYLKLPVGFASAASRQLDRRFRQVMYNFIVWCTLCTSCRLQSPRTERVDPVDAPLSECWASRHRKLRTG